MPHNPIYWLLTSSKQAYYVCKEYYFTSNIQRIKLALILLRQIVWPLHVPLVVDATLSLTVVLGGRELSLPGSPERADSNTLLTTLLRLIGGVGGYI